MTYSQELAVSRLQHNGQDSKQSGALKSINSVRKLSGKHGLESQLNQMPENPKELNPICSQADFLANLSVTPGSEKARQMVAISGRKCLDLYRKENRLGSLLKMLLDSTDWGSTSVFLTWKPSATKSLHRLKFQLVPWAQSIDEIESGLWPTVVATDYKGASTNSKRSNYTSKLCRFLHHFSPSQKTTYPNPAMLEPFMGYPIGHTELKQSEIPSCHKSPTKSSKQYTK